MQPDLIERGAKVNQAFLARGHARLCGQFVTVGDGLADFAHRGVLNEILLKPGVRWREGEAGRAVTVVHNIKGRQEETCLLPSTPLIVGINGSNTHVHGGAVGQRKRGWQGIGTRGPGGGERGPQGREVPCFVRR